MAILRPNNTGMMKTRALQHKLYLAAKQSPTRRFHALFDRVWREDVLRRAWMEVHANQGAPGVDGVTIEDVKAAGVGEFLDDLAVRLRDGTYRPGPVRRVWIPKPGKSEKRPLGIPNVVDRVVQQALKIVLEPIWEADFLPCSFGFRPKRSAHQALQAMRDAIRTGRTWVVDADIDSFFDRLGHDLILECLRERVSDRRVLKLIRVFLSSGVLDGAELSIPVEGAPQGGPLSPLLANVVLHRLDRTWRERFRRLGVLVRYADDEVICCPTQDRARAALVALEEILGELGLRVSTAKTRIVDLASGAEGCDFLGFHHRMMSSRRHPSRRYPACWPSTRTMGRARSRIRELTGRNRCHIPTHLVVADVNRYLTGWQGYFRFGNSSRWFAKLDKYVIERMALLISKRHGRRGRGNGMKHVIMSGNRLGLVKLSGTVKYGRIAHASR